MTTLTIKTPASPINILFVFLHLIIACFSPCRIAKNQYIYWKRRITRTMSKAKIVGENTMLLTNPNNSLNASFANHKEQKMKKQITRLPKTLRFALISQLPKEPEHQNIL
ncbi:hypothetical protein ACMGSP_005150 [Enterobacter cloacae]